MVPATVPAGRAPTSNLLCSGSVCEYASRNSPLTTSGTSSMSLKAAPAESAGLVPYGDYITGWSGGVLGAENDFYDLVEAVSFRSASLRG